MCVDGAGRPCSFEASWNLRYFLAVMQRADLSDAFSLMWNGGARFIGLSRQRVMEQARSADFLLNVMGFLTDEEILGSARQRVFLDIDPGFGQMWRELGMADVLRGHDRHVTIAENMGRPGCTIPTCGLEWITTRQPIVLDSWQPHGGSGRGSFTSIGSWRGAYGPVEYGDSTYGLRAHEFRRFAQLPQRSGHRFEIALDIHPTEVNDLALLSANGWSLVDPQLVAGDPWAYQAYIQGSMAEFMVAKSMYVKTRSGWFSDRSACYLASAKPVLAQDTALEHLYPTGEGLLTFGTFDEALAGCEELSRNGIRHSRAARAIAEAFFDSNRVLSVLLRRLGVA